MLGIDESNAKELADIMLELDNVAKQLAESAEIDENRMTELITKALTIGIGQVPSTEEVQFYIESFKKAVKEYENYNSDAVGYLGDERLLDSSESVESPTDVVNTNPD